MSVARSICVVVCRAPSHIRASPRLPASTPPLPQVEIDPSTAICKAEKVEVKTGEEDEETLLTLDKAKLFEYRKADGEPAVPSPSTPLHPPL